MIKRREGHNVTDAIRAFEHPVSIAPMMKRTDRHYRYFMRLISRRTLLYTEMVTAKAILHGDRDRLLAYDPSEHPVVLQVGGDDPRELAEVSRIAEDLGYDEINLNVGCPSERVQNGNFGVCLMETPEVVARAIEAMMQAVDIPVTVKHRIGVDDLDRYEDMVNFVRVVSQTGCTRFTVHARKAWLQGLSPKENRNIPPLRYDDVYRLKREFPQLVIEINGGVKTLDEVERHLEHVDAVMIGRAAYDNPYLFAHVDARFYGGRDAVRSRHEVVEAMYPYIEREIADGTKLSNITSHMLNLFKGCPGAKHWRRHLSENAWRDDAGVDTLAEALAHVPDPSRTRCDAVATS